MSCLLIASEARPPRATAGPAPAGAPRITSS